MSISKQEIIVTASKYFQEKGYHATSMSDIANELGVNKAALYYYVENKESILCEIFNQAMNAVEPLVTEIRNSNIPIPDKIRRIIHVHIVSLIEEMPILTVFFTERNHLPPEHWKLIKQRRHVFEETIADIFREGIKTGVFKNIDVQPVVYGLLGMCNWIYQWYKPGGRLNAENLAKVYSDLVLEGCLKKS
jgi:AcrR family transcriptional regulator